MEDGTIQTLFSITYADGSSDSFAIQSDVEPVPEPSTLALLGIGIAGMAAYGWRRRKPAEL